MIVKLLKRVICNFRGHFDDISTFAFVIYAINAEEAAEKQQKENNTNAKCFEFANK